MVSFEKKINFLKRGLPQTERTRRGAAAPPRRNPSLLLRQEKEGDQNSETNSKQVPRDD